MSVLLGAVAYDQKVVLIWHGFRSWLRDHDFNFDFVLYSNYERQTLALLDGEIDVAWNSPLAWIRSRRLAAQRGVQVRPLVMRDTDRDLVSVVVVRSDSDLVGLGELAGRTVATGAIDSPQATLLPILAIASQTGLHPGRDYHVLRFDVGVGLHGDHIGGERDAARAVQQGLADAACVTDTNLMLFARDGTLPTGSTRVVGQTDRYDHCNMTVGPSASEQEMARLGKLFLSMSYSDARLRPLLDLEGLKAWEPGRIDGYAALENAVDLAQFYGPDGEIHASDYRP